MYGLIYKIVNIKNEKIYFGQTTKSLEIRMKMHFKDAKRPKNKGIDGAIKKYGKQNFHYEIIGFCYSKQELDEAEKSCIELYQSNNKIYGYNIASGGQGSFGYKHSSEAKIKISQKSKENWLKDDYRNQLIPQIRQRFLANHKEILAKSHTPESNAKRVVNRKGKPLSNETKQKMKNARKIIGHTGGKIKTFVDPLQLQTMLNDKISRGKIAEYFKLSVSSINNRINELKNEEFREFVRNNNAVLFEKNNIILEE